MVRQSLRVLVIDRSPAALDALAALVESWGYDVERAPSGRAGLGAFIVKAPDIVILELALDDVDGCEIVRRMRAKATKSVAIIAFSAFESLREAAFTAGADDFVLKPDLAGLERALTRAVDREASRRAGTKGEGSRS